MSFPNVPSSTASVTIPNREDGWAPGPRDISVTPSGQHMWAMTPGGMSSVRVGMKCTPRFACRSFALNTDCLLGTKLMWTRDQLMHLSHSPLSKSPFQLPSEVMFLGKGAPVPEDHCEDNDSDGETGQTTTTTVQNGTEDGTF